MWKLMIMKYKLVSNRL